MKSNGLTVEIVRKGMVPLWSDMLKCWCVSDQWFYHFDYKSGNFSKVFRLPPKSTSLLGRITDFMARSTLRQWLRPRACIHHLVELPDGGVVVIYDKVYCYSHSCNTSLAAVIPIDIQPPLAWPLRGGTAVHPVSGSVYFGEYNDDPRGSRVVRIKPKTGEVVVCWRFARTEIRHVHAIHHDPFRNRIWICTGDRDHESSIYFTDDEFETVHRFAGGDQSWRAIALLFDENGMEWGMDAGQDAREEDLNRIYRYDFSTGQRTERALIGNPAYAVCNFDDGTAVLQTSFEPRRRQDTPAETALWWRNYESRWVCLMSLPFEAHKPCGAGRYGHLLIPIGLSPMCQLLCTPVNTRSQAMTMLRLRWGENITRETLPGDAQRDE